MRLLLGSAVVKLLPWITYRQFIVPLDELKSDSGWGCMIRSAQMLVATACLKSQGYKFAAGNTVESQFDLYSMVLEWFIDSPECPFSIHRLVEMASDSGFKAGDWFGPHAISTVFQKAITDFSASPVECYLSTDQVIYQDKISVQLTLKPVLILIPTRLGIDQLNLVYSSHLKKVFSFPHSVGIAGGKPNSAYFFIGSDQEKLLYLDPHHSRPAIPVDSLDFSSYSCSSASQIAIKSLDPCLCFGFLIENLTDYEAFKCLCMESVSSGPNPLFTFLDSQPELSESSFDFDE